MSINIKLQAFEGPLDLLLHLIEKAEVDIYDIPIAEITEQYMEYLHMMQELDLEVASEFLVMAATLLEVKSKMLLPKPKKEEKGAIETDPRAELVQKLLEYKKYKDISAEFKDKLSIYEKVFYKMPEPIEDYISDFTNLTGVSVDVLVKSLKSIMLRNTSPKEKKQTFRQIYREVVTVEDKIQEIAQLLTIRPLFFFDELFQDAAAKYEIIVTFLAILELIKRKSILIEQEQNFDFSIIVHPLLRFYRFLSLKFNLCQA